MAFQSYKIDRKLVMLLWFKSMQHLEFFKPINSSKKPFGVSTKNGKLKKNFIKHKNTNYRKHLLIWIFFIKNLNGSHCCLSTNAEHIYIHFHIIELLYRSIYFTISHELILLWFFILWWNRRRVHLVVSPIR